ncbi:MAG: SIS domain-containing protein [Gemmatimonadetes bacterium]|nr:SIS domain-containing protein [Gemmatimonadota bacterium]MDA1104218.1 SIS domain-containing protein [Gemmatimonadota bacterium]
MTTRASVLRHFAEHAAVVERVSTELLDPISELSELVLNTVRAGGTLLFCGNGGSAADAQHLAAEYVVRFARERRPIAAIALTTDTSLLTAAANDHGYDTIFERQIMALGRAGDLLVLHSTSGESENLMRAAISARAKGIATVALLAKGGGRLRAEVDLALVIPTDSTARAQEVHLTIGHIVCDLVEAAIVGSNPETTT